MNPERRKYPRYRLRRGETVVMGRDTNILAFVRNAGPGGMQLEYFSARSMQDQWYLVDLMTRQQEGLLISNLCCQTVYDMKVIAENGSFKGLDVRQCGLCFEALTDVQDRKLKLLLEQHQCQL